jgi:hypothetical protein
MDIGKQKPARVVEPITTPVPQRERTAPARRPQTAPTRTPAKTPEKAPVKVPA